jgi:hypothetical protein
MNKSIVRDTNIFSEKEIRKGKSLHRVKVRKIHRVKVYGFFSFLKMRFPEKYYYIYLTPECIDRIHFRCFVCRIISEENSNKYCKTKCSYHP